MFDSISQIKCIQSNYDHIRVPITLEHPTWALLWLMRRAEEAYKDIADHQVLSHIHHAKNAVPFKTFATTDPQQASSKFFGGIAFGSNVFLRCHTDQDFTMSISQVFCKDKSHYRVDDEVIV